jgi:hypothetical protein
VEAGLNVAVHAEHFAGEPAIQLCRDPLAVGMRGEHRQPVFLAAGFGQNQQQRLIGQGGPGEGTVKDESAGADETVHRWVHTFGSDFG